MKTLHEKGHQLASHTWSHKHLPELNWDQRKTASFLEPFLALNHTRCFLQSTARCGALKVCIVCCSLSPTWLTGVFCDAEALIRIVGVQPAFVRPRASIFVPSFVGNVTDRLYLEFSLWRVQRPRQRSCRASRTEDCYLGSRVSPSLCYLVTCRADGYGPSTGDTVGFTPAQSKALFDQAIAKKPSTIHSLAHETMCKSPAVLMTL